MNTAPTPCGCDACKDGTIHASDCAVHNAPALSVGPCDCSTGEIADLQAEIERLTGALAASEARDVGELTDERLAFEAWFQSDTVPGSIGFFDRDPSNSDEYKIFEVQCEWRAWQARAALATRASEAALVAPEEPHTDDMAVDTFARVMKNKMGTSRAKGRGGWEATDPADLSRMLREHVEKGDPIDVANLCMMLWHLQAVISPSQAAPVAVGDAKTDEYKIAYQEGHFEGYQEAMREATPDGYLYGDHERTFDCPDDAAMMGGRKLGDRYTVTAVFYEEQQFEVVKVADEDDDDWAVRRVEAALASQAAPATTIYDPEFVRNKFADYETQILNLREELAVRRGSQTAPETTGAVRPMTQAEVDAQPDWIKSARTPEAS